MDASAIYKKTALGSEEVASRSHGLSSLARTMLIMVDGRRTAATLIGQSTKPVEAQSQLAALLDGGFIGIVEPPALAASPAASVPAATRAPVDLGTVKHYIIETLHGMLGPDADPFTVKVEAANDAPALTALCEKFYQVIHGVGGKRKADDFREKVASMLA